MKDPRLSKSHSVLLIGNFFSTLGGSRGPIEDLHDALVQDGVSVHRASMSTSRLRRLVDILFAILMHGRKADIAVVDVYSGAAFLTALVACMILRMRQIPYVLTLHGGALPDFRRRYPALVDFVLCNAYRITCPSQYLMRAFSGYTDSLVLLPNPIDFGRYSSIIGTYDTVRILWLRAFHETYNPQMAVHAFARVRETSSDAVMTMAGPDKGDGSLQACIRLARELGVESSITFMGAIPKKEVPELMSRHGIYINTTHVDNTPVTLIEAMASGLNVISTNVGGIPDLVTHDIHGLLVPEDDADAMADAVLHLLDNQALAASLRQAARMHAQAFDISVVSTQWMKLIADVRMETR